jgi:hypothetical protein
MPALLPPSPESLVEGIQFFINFWLPVGYYTPGIQAELTSRFLYFRLFIEDLLVSPLIRHAPSKTLVGGYNGCVWLVRALILLIFNFAAVSGDLLPPSETPANYDLTRLPLDELTHVLGWSRQVIEALRASTSTLAASSEARKSFVPEPAPAQPHDSVAGPFADPSESPASHDTHPTTGVPPSATQKKSKSSKRQHRRAPGKQPTGTRGDKSEDSMSSGASDKSIIEPDFEKLDVRSDHSSDLDPDGYTSNPTLPSPQSPLGRGRSASSIAYHKHTVRITGRSTHHLQDECLDLFKSGACNFISSSSSPILILVFILSRQVALTQKIRSVHSGPCSPYPQLHNIHYQSLMRVSAQPSMPQHRRSKPPLAPGTRWLPFMQLGQMKMTKLLDKSIGIYCISFILSKIDNST